MNFKTSSKASQVKSKLEQLPINFNKDVCVLEFKDGRIIIISMSQIVDNILNQDNNYVEIPFTEKERSLQAINGDIPTNISGNSSLYQ